MHKDGIEFHKILLWIIITAFCGLMGCNRTALQISQPVQKTPLITAIAGLWDGNEGVTLSPNGRYLLYRAGGKYPSHEYIVLIDFERWSRTEIDPMDIVFPHDGDFPPDIEIPTACWGKNESACLFRFADVLLWLHIGQGGIVTLVPFDADKGHAKWPSYSYGGLTDWQWKELADTYELTCAGCSEISTAGPYEMVSKLKFPHRAVLVETNAQWWKRHTLVTHSTSFFQLFIPIAFLNPDVYGTIEAVSPNHQYVVYSITERPCLFEKWGGCPSSTYLYDRLGQQKTPVSLVEGEPDFEGIHLRRGSIYQIPRSRSPILWRNSREMIYEGGGKGIASINLDGILSPELAAYNQVWGSCEAEGRRHAEKLGLWINGSGQLPTQEAWSIIAQLIESETCFKHGFFGSKDFMYPYDSLYSLAIQRLNTLMNDGNVPLATRMGASLLLGRARNRSMSSVENTSGRAVPFLEAAQQQSPHLNKIGSAWIHFIGRPDPPSMIKAIEVLQSPLRINDRLIILDWLTRSSSPKADSPEIIKAVFSEIPIPPNKLGRCNPSLEARLISEICPLSLFSHLFERFAKPHIEEMPEIVAEAITQWVRSLLAVAQRVPNDTQAEAWDRVVDQLIAITLPFEDSGTTARVLGFPRAGDWDERRVRDPSTTIGAMVRVLGQVSRQFRGLVPDQIIMAAANPMTEMKTIEDSKARERFVAEWGSITQLKTIFHVWRGSKIERIREELCRRRPDDCNEIKNRMGSSPPHGHSATATLRRIWVLVDNRHLHINHTPKGELVIGRMSVAELSVSGFYSDMIDRAIDDDPDTTYSSSDKKIVEVIPPGKWKNKDLHPNLPIDPKIGEDTGKRGLVRAVGLGRAEVIVRNGVYEDRVTVTVTECPEVTDILKCP